MQSASALVDGNGVNASTTSTIDEASVRDAVESAWFEAPASVRRPSVAPNSVEKVGEFLGDPLVDAWLR